MKDDLISRHAAIDALRYAQHRFTVADEAGGMGTVKWSEDVIYFAAAERVLSELPSAQPEQRWIPCSESLPGEHALTDPSEEESIDYVNIVCYYSVVGRPTESEKKHDND